jgi:hypothetical protein
MSRLVSLILRRSVDDDTSSASLYNTVSGNSPVTTYPSMVSHLQHAPLNVLIHIATLSGSSHVLEPPTDVLHLSLSNHYFYSALSVRSCPQLYANLFYARFDTAAVLRRLRSVHVLTSSALCAELVQRYRAMRRIRRRDMSDQNMAQDLFTILMMVYESDGLNEMQLTAAGLPQYIHKLLRTRLPHSFVNEIDPLVIWLSWLTLSRRESLPPDLG